jgi:hypothetical protein
MTLGRLVRDALLVVAPAAAVMAGVASVTHRQRLVEAGYRVGRLQAEREDLDVEVQAMRVAVGRLSSPSHLLGEVRRRNLPLDYPRGWNHVDGDQEAHAFTFPARASGNTAKRGAAGKGARP